MDILIEQPNGKQRLFLLDRHKHIAFGGARGGGKSWAVRTKAKLLAFRYSGIRLLIVRRSYPELMNNHINILRNELAGAAVYNDRDKILRFMNGSTINFMYCDRDGDLDRIQGVEYDVIFIDEATLAVGVPDEKHSGLRKGSKPVSKACILHLQSRRKGTRLHKKAFCGQAL